MFHDVSRKVLCGKRNTFATFSEDALQFSRQAQHFGDLRCHFAWQAQHFQRVGPRVFANRIVSAAQSGDKVQIPWQAWHFVTPHSTLYTLHPTLYTPHFKLYTPHFTLTLYTPHFTLYTHTLHSTLDTVHFTLHTLYCTLHTWHLTLYTPRFTLYTPHSTLYTPHFTVYTPHSKLYTAHFTYFTPRSTLYTSHFTLPFSSPITMIPGLVILRVGIRVRGFHLVFLRQGTLTISIDKHLDNFKSAAKAPIIWTSLFRIWVQSSKWFQPWVGNQNHSKPLPKHGGDVIHVAALLNPTRARLRAAAKFSRFTKPV